ncbi:unnamed protein product, partial [Ectocarpus sp. 12 AP-2014]
VWSRTCSENFSRDVGGCGLLLLFPRFVAVTAVRWSGGRVCRDLVNFTSDAAAATAWRSSRGGLRMKNHLSADAFLTLRVDVDVREETPTREGGRRGMLSSPVCAPSLNFVEYN